MSDFVVRRVVRVGGMVEVFDGPLSEFRLKEKLGANVVSRVKLPNGMMLVVDEFGATKGLHVNDLATMVYQNQMKPHTPCYIFGDAAIVPQSDF